jgi:hypothetical protein
MSLKDKRLKHMEKWEGKMPAPSGSSKKEDAGDALGQTSTRVRKSKSSSSTPILKPQNVGKMLRLIVDCLKEQNGATIAFDDLIEKALAVKKEGDEPDIDMDDSNQQNLLNEMKKALYEDEKTRSQVISKLKENPKIDVGASQDKPTFTYKSTYQLSNAQDIINLLKSVTPEGVDCKELKDSYKTIDEDIAKLKEEGRVYFMKNKEMKSDILFYKDPMMVMDIDQELRAMFRATVKKLPDAQHMPDFDTVMKANDLKPMETIVWATDKTALERKALEEEEKKGKQKRKSRKIKNVTNAHMLDTINFNGEN